MISLTAEQKNLEGMYCSSTEQYIVPQYQRPYSWTFDQCSELFRDIMSAYDDNDSYFLGNVILARSRDFDLTGQSYIVDGQQRLITVWTLIKVLSLLLPDVNTLRSSLSVTPWQGDENEPKIKSLIFENKDDEAINAVFHIEKDKLTKRYDELIQKYSSLKEEKCNSQIEASLLYFYEQITNSSKLSSEVALMKFAQFLMKRVTMLPIVQTASNTAEATDKALTIFETINNRGLDLEDADIFKARLYDSAYDEQHKKEFINMWVDFKAECDRLRLSIDDVFRYYSHIIRGKQGITTSEKRLRDFFTNEPFSPLSNSTYDEVLSNLNKILQVIQYLKKETSNGGITEPGSWLQIINEYTNQYPIYAVVAYVYNHEIETEEGKNKVVNFLKSLVRYCLYTGSTSSVKFGIYPIIKTISFQDSIDDNYPTEDITIETFNHLGRLKNAFALLTYLLETKQAFPKKYTVDKIVNLRDEDLLGEDWTYNNLNDICNSIGNLVVLDIPKRYNTVNDKKEYYATSNNHYVNQIFTTNIFHYDDWKKRDMHMKNLLIDFFKKKI